MRDTSKSKGFFLYHAKGQQYLRLLKSVLKTYTKLQKFTKTPQRILSAVLVFAVFS